ncbi:MAG TPA: nucleotidyltransferase family protein [Gemmatimonadales bacterium]|nr:nucleotidyltransferase family protein [Gemmatimonadales bacterium]
MFLRAERCAVALSTRTEGDAPPLLHAAATVELQRILSARAQIEELGRQVAAIGERVVVLKGGLMALGSSAGIDLVDIDILTEPASASRIAGLLDSRGYLTYGPGSPVHLAQRRQEFAVPIEVHHALTELPASDVWARAEPVPGRPGRPGLWRPAAIDQAWHALVHSAVTHPFRRGSLRDLLLIGWAEHSLDDAGRRALEGQVRAHPRGEMLAAMLRLAREIRDSRAPGDPFLQEAAAHYQLTRKSGALGQSVLKSSIMLSVYATLDGGRARLDYWHSVWNGRDHRSPWPLLARVETAWPPAGKWLRRVLRILRLPVAELNAFLIVRRAKRLAGAHGGREAKTLVMRSGEP